VGEYWINMELAFDPAAGFLSGMAMIAKSHQRRARSPAASWKA
jgi:hypothetical protein